MFTLYPFTDPFLFLLIAKKAEFTRVYDVFDAFAENAKIKGISIIAPLSNISQYVAKLI